jgi:hypothetical protein
MQNPERLSSLAAFPVQFKRKMARACFIQLGLGLAHQGNDGSLYATDNKRYTQKAITECSCRALAMMP